MNIKIANANQELAELSAKQIKIKSYPSFDIIFSKIKLEEDKISETFSIYNKGEMTAHKVSLMFIQCYYNEQKKELYFNVAGSTYYGQDKSVTTFNFEMKILPGSAKEINHQWGSIPPGYTAEDIKYALVFIRFFVPYDKQYSYETVGYILKNIDKINSSGASWQVISTTDRERLIKKLFKSKLTKSKLLSPFFSDYKR